MAHTNCPQDNDLSQSPVDPYDSSGDTKQRSVMWLKFADIIYNWQDNTTDATKVTAAYTELTVIPYTLSL